MVNLNIFQQYFALPTHRKKHRKKRLSGEKELKTSISFKSAKEFRQQTNHKQTDFRVLEVL